MSNIKIKVLIVEDIKIQQKLAALTLEALPCEITIADNGTQAIELINKHHYDIMFMDVGLDDMDGLTLTEIIRKLEGQNKFTPIIALTAHTDEEIKAKCLEVGMDDLMEKPIKIEVIQDIFNKYFFKNTIQEVTTSTSE